METSKIFINILIVTAIILIGVSVTSVLVKKSNEQIVVMDVATTTEKITEEIPVTIATTTTESTTTEVASITSTTTISSTSTNKVLTGKKWTWVRTTINASSTTPKKATAFTITFTATGTLTGTTDCNNFFGTYKSSSSTLTFGPLGSTKMFCEESQEGEFMISLQGVSGYSTDKSNLILSTGMGTVIFR